MPRKTRWAAAEPGVPTDQPVPADPAPAPPKPLDPARIAARLLLDRTLSEADISVGDASRDGSVTLILVPSADWTDVARRAWSEWARPDAECREGSAGSYNKERYWTSLSADEAPRPPTQKDRANVLAKAVSKGLHVAGFAPEREWLPEDLIRAADYCLRLPPLSAEDIRRLAIELCGDEPVSAVNDSEIAAVTPKDLRLARRIGQSAEGYIGKLKSLLPAEPAPRTVSFKSDNRVAPTLDRLHGMKDAVAWGMALARDLEAFMLGELPWSHVDRGCMLSGAPGTGKTIFAKALAATCKVPLITATYAQWQGSGAGYLGDFLKAMTGTFRDARASAPCILFIDEIDSFPDREKLADRNRDYTVQTVNALLAEIDGSERIEGVVVIGACNFPHRVDPALVRSGRLDRHIRIRKPNRTDLAAILREHLGDDLGGADLTHAATSAVGATGADCEQLVRGARRRARTARRPLMMTDLLAEIEGDVPAHPGDIWTAAIHEAGHAVAACVQHPGCLSEVCLIMRDGTGGQTQAEYSGTRYPSADDLRSFVVTILAGRAAETEILGTPTSGAGGGSGSDLSLATFLTVEIYTSLGLDEAGGLLWSGVNDTAAVPAALAADPAMAQRVRAYLDEAYATACGLIRKNRTAVIGIAELLLEKRVVDGPQAEEIVRMHAHNAKSSLRSAWDYPWGSAW